MAKVKVNITIDDALLSEIDDYCDKNFLNRSGLFSQAVVAVLNQQKMIDSISTLSVALKTAVEKGSVDEDTRRQIESFEALSRLFVK